MTYLSKTTIIKWLIYSGIILNSLIMFFDIRDNYTIRIVGSVFCPAFGSNWRCEILSMVGIFGVLSGLIMISVGIIATSKKNNIIKSIYKTESILCLIQSFIFSIFLGNSITWMNEVHSAILLSRMPGYIFFNVLLFSVAFFLSAVDKSTNAIKNKNIKKTVIVD